MEVIRRNYPEVPATASPHFQSVRVGNLLFLAGATGRYTEAEHGDMAAQTDVILRRIQYIVEVEGGSLDNVVKITSFVTDMSEEAGAATHLVRTKYFGENLPASTRVQVAGLVEPHLMIEIEAIAVLPK
jgi:2-iminobutanoate/2-iminopropanoate deaminase